MPSSSSPLFGLNFPLATSGPFDRTFFNNMKRLPKTQKLLDVLIGAVAGTTATVTRKRVASANPDFGGQRPIESRTIVNRATTSADRTRLRNMFSEDSKIATPVNKAGSFSATTFKA